MTTTAPTITTAPLVINLTDETAGALLKAIITVYHARDKERGSVMLGGISLRIGTDRVGIIAATDGTLLAVERLEAMQIDAPPDPIDTTLCVEPIIKALRALYKASGKYGAPHLMATLTVLPPLPPFAPRCTLRFSTANGATLPAIETIEGIYPRYESAFMRYEDQPGATVIGLSGHNLQRIIDIFGEVSLRFDLRGRGYIATPLNAAGRHLEVLIMPISLPQ